MADEPTTPVACSECRRGLPPRYLVAGMCTECASKRIEMFNRWFRKTVADLVAILAEVDDPLGEKEETEETEDRSF